MKTTVESGRTVLILNEEEHSNLLNNCLNVQGEEFTLIRVNEEVGLYGHKIRMLLFHRAYDGKCYRASVIFHPIGSFDSDEYGYMVDLQDYGLYEI